MSDTIETPSAIDTLSADEIALRDSMRDEADAPAVEEAPVAVEDVDLDTEAEPQHDNRTRTVPHQQFHAANERRKAAEAKAAALELKMTTEVAKAQERLDLLMRVAQQAGTPAPAAPEPPIEVPDVATDPVGHFKALYEKTQREVQEVRAIATGLTEQTQKAQAVSELQRWGSAQESAFMQQQPAYKEAMDFLTAGRHAELEAAGVTDANARANIIMGDVTQIALRSREEGVNFAERLFNIATKRGFAAKKSAAPADLPALDQDAALPAAAARAQRGRDSALTIGSAGAAPAPQLSPERIASLSEAEFGRLVDKMRATGGNALRDLMGH